MEVVNGLLLRVKIRLCNLRLEWEKNIKKKSEKKKKEDGRKTGVDL